MRELVRDYLEGAISRRTFVRRMTIDGFTTLAATSALDSLKPLSVVHAAETDDGTLQPVNQFNGRVGELLADQLKAAGVEFLFLGNGSGLGSLCDALVDRPTMRIIQGIHEGQVASIADGYAKASGRTAFAMW